MKQPGLSIAIAVLDREKVPLGTENAAASYCPRNTATSSPAVLRPNDTINRRAEEYFVKDIETHGKRGTQGCPAQRAPRNSMRSDNRVVDGGNISPRGESQREEERERERYLIAKLFDNANGHGRGWYTSRRETTNRRDSAISRLNISDALSEISIPCDATSDLHGSRPTCWK